MRQKNGFSRKKKIFLSLVKSVFKRVSDKGKKIRKVSFCILEEVVYSENETLNIVKPQQRTELQSS